MAAAQLQYSSSTLQVGSALADQFPLDVFLRSHKLFVEPKGVGPSATLAWPGWKQSDIAVEVDTDRLETSQFKKCCANCVLLYFPSTEFKSAFNVY
jgi:hypothetical protein